MPEKNPGLCWFCPPLGRPGFAGDLDEACFSDEIKVLEHLVHTVRRELEQSLGIPARVKLVEAGTMEDYRERLGQIIDERSNG